MASTEPREIEFQLSRAGSVIILRLESADENKRLTRGRVLALTEVIEENLSASALIITGNQRFFSAGADLHEIARLTGSSAFEFAMMGQRLMNAVANYPALTVAAINGYCMGGGLDLALACK